MPWRKSVTHDFTGESRRRKEGKRPNVQPRREKAKKSLTAERRPLQYRQGVQTIHIYVYSSFLFLYLCHPVNCLKVPLFGKKGRGNRSSRSFVIFLFALLSQYTLQKKLFVLSSSVSSFPRPANSINETLHRASTLTSKSGLGRANAGRGSAVFFLFLSSRYHQHRPTEEALFLACVC